MALTELRSDLSWYGTRAPGFRPNKDRTTTDFQYNSDLTVTTTEQGYADRGTGAVSFRRITTADAFTINSGHDAQGTARRLTQLGAGSKFPVGPFGDVHEFDQVRTGFSPESRYGDVYSAKTTAGLADTYTTNSPINDMYNRFKVRDEAYNAFPYAREPFILRGIQRDDNSDPQRWGILPTVRFEIPRSGAVTFAQRLAIDAARIGKFLASPNGLAFIGQQTALYLMSPNTEGISGNAKLGLLNKPVYNPLSAFSNMTVHVPANLQLLRYGDIFTARQLATTEITANRLVRLRGERGIANFTWGTLSAPTGPNSFGGIGATTFRAPWKNNTSLGKILLETTDDFGLRYYAATDTYTQPYQRVNDRASDRSRTNIDELEQKTLLGSTNLDAPLEGAIARQSLRKRVETDKQFKGYTNEPTENPPDSKSKTTDKLTNFNVLSYTQIPKRNGSKDILDHRTGEVFDVDKLPMSKFINTTADKKLQDITDPFTGLCKFSIIGTSFKAYIQGISDDVSRSTQNTENPDTAASWATYTSYDRSISVDFTVPIERRKDFGDIWDKLNALGSAAGRSDNSLPAKGNLQIGDFINMYGFIDNLSISWDNESPWEITEGSQAPLYANVSMTFKYQPASGTDVGITSFTPPALYSSMTTPIAPATQDNI